MSTDGQFTLHAADVHLPRYTHPFVLVPWGDVHRFSASCDLGRWRQFCRVGRREVQRDPAIRYLGMGDLDDMLSRSERRAFLTADLHGGTREELDAYVRAKMKTYMHELDWMRGRCLGLLTGNHWWQYEDGSTTTQELAKHLGCPLLGDLGYISVYLRTPYFSGVPVEIVAHHGRAGGKLLGTSINQIEDLRNAFPMADAYMMGHDHQRGCWPVSRLLVHRHLGRMGLRQKRQLMVRTGSFLRAYEPGHSSYLVHRIARPADLGIVKLQFTIRRRRVGARSGIVVLDVHSWS